MAFYREADATRCGKGDKFQCCLLPSCNGIKHGKPWQKREGEESATHSPDRTEHTQNWIPVVLHRPPEPLKQLRHLSLIASRCPRKMPLDPLLIKKVRWTEYWFLKNNDKPSVVAQACNPSYLKGTGQEGSGFEANPRQKVMETSSQPKAVCSGKSLSFQLHREAQIGAW
jgi:hypothetical protein